MEIYDCVCVCVCVIVMTWQLWAPACQNRQKQAF